MSRIDNLIAKLCPNGVEYKALEEVCSTISAGGDLPEHYEKGQLIPTDRFPYPIYSNGSNKNSLYGFTDTYRIDQDAVTVSARGTIGYHAVRKKFFTPIVRLITLLPDNRIITAEFLNYALDITEIGHSGGSIPQLTVPNIKKVCIPVPPLEIQRKIVNVLDTFTKLEAELEAELEARRRQYHYYRDQLLNFEGRDDVQWVTLGEVIVNLRTGLNPRQNFVLNPPDAKNYYITVRELGGLHIVLSDKTDKINDDALKIINNRSKLRTGDVLFSGTGTIGNTALIECAPSNWNIKEGVYALTPNIKKIISKFLLYILKTTYVLSQINNYSAGSTVVSISMANFKRVIIPVPSLEEQARIVATLDKFDALVNDLSSGLPAEIAARRKQYEYYRDRLLTFKEAQ